MEEKKKTISKLAGCKGCGRPCLWNGDVAREEGESGKLFGCNDKNKRS